MNFSFKNLWLPCCSPLHYQKQTKKQCTLYYWPSKPITAWKVYKYGVFSGPYFPTFGLNTERYGVFNPNAGKYGPKNFRILSLFAQCIWRKICLINKGMLASAKKAQKRGRESRLNFKEVLYLLHLAKKSSD